MRRYEEGILSVGQVHIDRKQAEEHHVYVRVTDESTVGWNAELSEEDDEQDRLCRSRAAVGNTGSTVFKVYVQDLKGAQYVNSHARLHDRRCPLVARVVEMLETRHQSVADREIPARIEQGVLDWW